jgi:O-antigen/teichoic acid export membrane protein
MSSVGKAVTESLSTSLLLKLFSFAIGILTVRVSSVSDYGKVSVNFQLVLSLSLFLLKEGFRRCALRLSDSKQGLGILTIGSIATCILIIPGISVGYFSYFPGENVWVILTILLSLEMESIAEIFMFYQAAIVKNFQVRNRAETWSGLARSILMLGVLLVVPDGALAFAVSQLVGAWILLVIPLHAGGKGALVWPQKSDVISLIEMIAMATQKMFLAEGERILTLSFFSSEEAGLVSVASNLGSLLLRLIFAPIEDIAFTAFARESRPNSLKILRAVLLIEVTVGLLALGFGPVLAEPILFVLYGDRWTAAAPLLRIFLSMIVLFALNGCLEAYFYATVGSAKIRLSFVAQWVSFGALVLTVWLFSDQGPTSILFANSISMTVRILWSLTAFSKVSEVIHPWTTFVLVRVLVGATINWFFISRLPIASSHLGKLAVGASIGLMTLFAIQKRLRTVLASLHTVKDK